MPRSLLAAALLVSLASTAHGQTRPVSFMVKVAAEPQIGVGLQLGERVSLRALAATAFDFERGSLVANVGALYRLSESGPVTTHLGLTTTITDDDGFALAGLLFSAEYALSDRFGVFGDAALDADFNDNLGTLRTVNNSGVGIRLRL